MNEKVSHFDTSSNFWRILKLISFIFLLANREILDFMIVTTTTRKIFDWIMMILAYSSLFLSLSCWRWFSLSQIHTHLDSLSFQSACVWSLEQSVRAYKMPAVLILILSFFSTILSLAFFLLLSSICLSTYINSSCEKENKDGRARSFVYSSIPAARIIDEKRSHDNHHPYSSIHFKAYRLIGNRMFTFFVF